MAPFLAYGLFGLLALGPLNEARSPRPIHVQLKEGHSITELMEAPQIQSTMLSAHPLFSRSTASLKKEAAQLKAQGHEVPDLSRWWRLDAKRAGLLTALKQHPGVTQAFYRPWATPASFKPSKEAAPSDDACPIKTPSYVPYQGYLSMAPSGINAPAAWSRPGGKGEGVWFADIEGAWNFSHEDLPGERMKHVAGERIENRHWESHGTAVVGVVSAKDNELGMVGIAPNVERIFTASLGQIGTAAAIYEAQSKMRFGDVLLIELHAPGPRGRFIPMEFWDDIFDAIKVATARGVVVIAAAGNGAENLDHRAYQRKFDPNFRDSGAILVGAGAPDAPGFKNLSRLDFSNYGKRVNVQGWGRRVATLDYGDLQGCDAKHRKYTRHFSGTSSASPVVVGAAILLQSVYKKATGRALSPRALRGLLEATGTAQTDGPHGPTSQNIGPRPDLQRALKHLDELAAHPQAPTCP